MMNDLTKNTIIVSDPPSPVQEYLRSTTTPNVCLSGGAAGADLEWGRCAALAGHEVIHWSFSGHRSQAPRDQIVELTSSQLDMADETLAKAALLLNKSPPKRTNVRNLLQRNYYQVAWSDAVYAVSFLPVNGVSGGTMWAVAIFRVLHPERPCFLFCQEKRKWFRGVKQGLEWELVDEDEVPSPEGVWAGIGARDLRDCGREAIQRMTGCEVCGKETGGVIVNVTE